MREFVLETVAPCLIDQLCASRQERPAMEAATLRCADKSRGESAAVCYAALVTVEKCY